MDSMRRCGISIGCVLLALVVMLSALPAQAQNDPCSTKTNPVDLKKFVSIGPKQFVSISNTSLLIKDGSNGTDMTVNGCLRYAATEFPYFRTDVKAMFFDKRGNMVGEGGAAKPPVPVATILLSGPVQAQSVGWYFGIDGTPGYRLDHAQIARQVLF